MWRAIDLELLRHNSIVGVGELFKFFIIIELVESIKGQVRSTFISEVLALVKFIRFS